MTSDFVTAQNECHTSAGSGNNRERTLVLHRRFGCQERDKPDLQVGFVCDVQIRRCKAANTRRGELRLQLEQPFVIRNSEFTIAICVQSHLEHPLVISKRIRPTKPALFVCSATRYRTRQPQAPIQA